MIAVDDAVPVKEEHDSDGQDDGGAGDFTVVVKTETLEVEVGPVQLQPQDVAWAVKEEPGSDDESGLVVDEEGEVKLEVEVGPKELQPPGEAGRAGSTGKMADGKPSKPPNRAPRVDVRKSHSYCSVYGCLTNDFENPELSFFKIPMESERRIQWLELILRKDLIEKTTINRVCETHFNPQDIRKSVRKTLKSNALPCLNLPDRLKKDVQTQTHVDTAESCSQADATALSSSSSQTDRRSRWVSDNETQTPAPRKRKLKSEFKDCRKRVKELENEPGSQIHMFHELCDRFLSSDLTELVRAETKLIR